MRYKQKVEKVSPMPGRYKDLQIQVVSSVDSPANQIPFLQIKGEKKKGMLTELQKSQMRAAGISDAKIAEEDNGNGMISKIAKFFGLGEQPAQEPVKTEQPLTLEAIEKMMDKKLEGIKKTSEPEVPPVNSEPDLATQNAELEKQIADEKAKIEADDNLVQKNLNLQNELEEVKKMRGVSNSVYKSNQEVAKSRLSEEEVAELEIDKIFENSVFYS